MGKRIEEFTAEELRNVYYDLSNDDPPLAVLDYIKANLDTGKREPMSVEEIVAHIREEIKKYGWGSIESSNAQRNISTQDELVFTLARIVKPLTVQQGFVPDWSKAPDYAIRAEVVWSAQDEPWHTEFHSFPRPAPKMRELSTAAKRADLLRYVHTLYDPDKIDDLCRAAGIPLEVAE